jgi:uncharacterized oxidoreductase
VNTTGNAIFITGATPGIGRGLAEAIHKRGNTVIVSGRHKALPDEITAANPGMAAIQLDTTDRMTARKIYREGDADSWRTRQRG